MTVSAAVNKMVYNSSYFFDNASIKTFEDAAGTRIYFPRPHQPTPTQNGFDI